MIPPFYMYRTSLYEYDTLKTYNCQYLYRIFLNDLYFYLLVPGTKSISTTKRAYQLR